VLAQLAGLYALCDGQIDKARARDARMAADRQAVARCREMRPRASLKSCAAEGAAPVGGADTPMDPTPTALADR